MLTSKLFKSIIMPYLLMILNMKQTAIDLLPENEAEFEIMPEMVSIHFFHTPTKYGVRCKWPGI